KSLPWAANTAAVVFMISPEGVKICDREGWFVSWRQRLLLWRLRKLPKQLTDKIVGSSVRCPQGIRSAQTLRPSAHRTHLVPRVRDTRDRWRKSNYRRTQQRFRAGCFLQNHP